MTVSQGIIEWLKGYRLEGFTDIGRINTDRLEATAVSLALNKAPVQNIKHYMDGSAVYTEHYQFLARFDTGTNTERVENQAYLNGLEEYIKASNREKRFPVLGEGRECMAVQVVTPFYLGNMTERTSVYELTISVKYRKGK